MKVGKRSNLPRDSIDIMFSAQTSSNITQSSIEEKLDKKKRDEFGAAPNRKNIIFVDDVNMPQPEIYGA